jgi:hypothetical protein
MFYSVDDIQPAVQVATELFGPVGSMMDGKNVTKNVLIGTREFGKIWYGDVEGDLEFITGLCSVLTQRIGQTAMVVEDNF